MNQKLLDDARAAGFHIDNNKHKELSASNIFLIELLTKFAELQKPQWISVKDGLPEKKCLAYYINEMGNKRTVCAKYTKKYTEESRSDDEWIDYCETDDTYYYPEGWYEMIDNWDDYNFVTINYQVTHWMPLPSPPTDKDIK